MNDIDEAIFEIWDNFRVINADFYCICGISSPVYSAFISPNNLFGVNALSILSKANEAFAKRRSGIEGGIRAIREHHDALFS